MGKWLLPHAESGIGALTEELLRLAALYPGLSIYLPHMGWPRRDKKDENDWHRSISRLSKVGNLIISVSAIAHFSDEAFPHDDVSHFAAYLLATFGQESLVAGSDYPLFEKDRYTQYIQLAGKWIAGSMEAGHRFEARLFGEQLANQQG